MRISENLIREADSRETSPALWWAITELAEAVGMDADELWEYGVLPDATPEETLERLLPLAPAPEYKDDTLIWGACGVVARAVERDGRLVWEAV